MGVEGEEFVFFRGLLCGNEVELNRVGVGEFTTASFFGGRGIEVVLF